MAAPVGAAAAATYRLVTSPAFWSTHATLTKYSPVMLIKLERLAAAFIARSMQAQPGRASIRKNIGCPAKESGRWHLMGRIKTHCLSGLTPPESMLFRVVPTACQQQASSY